MGSLRVAPILFALISSVDACMRVTPGEPGIPAVPCKSCDKGLLATEPTMAGSGQKKFDGDVVDPTGACNERTLTCKGHLATIELFDAGGVSIGSVDDMGTGTATFAVTCNAAGTAWFATANNMDYVITRADCNVAYCYRCDETMLTVNEAGPGVKMMDDDQITFTGTGGCAQRTFTCKGNGATIGISTAAGAIAPVTDMGTGTATYVVDCNDDGTGWVAGGQTITQVECRNTAPGTCTGCTNAQLVTTPMGNGAKQFTTDDPVPGACLKRMLTCVGNGATIELFDAGGSKGAPAIQSITLDCNAGGTGWSYMGIPLTRIECSYTTAG